MTDNYEVPPSTSVGHVHLRVADQDRAIGFCHAAFLSPDRAALVAVIKRGKAAGIRFDGAAHHGVSTAVYRRDPDGNGESRIATGPKRCGQRMRREISPCSMTGFWWTPKLPRPEPDLVLIRSSR